MLSSLPYMIENHPRSTAVMFVAMPILMGFVISDLEADRPRREAASIAHDKARLECRQSGREFEYFGSQGYACVPALSKGDEK